MPHSVGIKEHIRLYFGEFVKKFENILEHEPGTLMGLLDEKKPEVENLVTLSL
jgi:hypothetical protein